MLPPTVNRLQAGQIGGKTACNVPICSGPARRVPFMPCLCGLATGHLEFLR